jgi:serine/threonine-protein kinase
MTDIDRLTTALSDRYRIEHELGAGGMATVYLAHDLKHDRKVAVKVLRPELAVALGPDRFLREIKVTAQLNHPHILTLIDSGQADGFLYYVMPYVEGESLRERLRRDKRIPIDEALGLTAQIASALEHAHRQNIVHRDIKPENILIHEGEAVVADFGIALAVSAAGGGRLTETGLALGTPEYMSPEQASGETRLDGRSDVYSLGCVLYEMVGGEPPFGGSMAQEIIGKQISAPVPSVRRLHHATPVSVDEALMKALAKAPGERFAHATEFVEALQVRRALPASWYRRAGIAVGAWRISYTRQWTVRENFEASTRMRCCRRCGARRPMNSRLRMRASSLQGWEPGTSC